MPLKLRIFGHFSKLPRREKKTGNERCNVTAGTHERIAAQVLMGNTSRLLLVSFFPLFQPCLRDVAFMVAAITYGKELGISVRKLASSEMTSLK